MKELAGFVINKLHLIPEQVQIFIPLPSTWSTVMYVTGRNPWTGEEIYVERDARRRALQKAVLTDHPFKKCRK